MAPADEAVPPADIEPSAVVEFDGGRASEAVISAIAAETGVDPLRLPPLCDVVDPDALDALMAHARSSDAVEEHCQWVSFRYEGYDVFVCADGRVLLQPGE